VELLDLILPTHCALCDKSGASICAQCKTKFVPRRFDIQRNFMPGYAATEYSEATAKLIHEFKERGQTELAKFFVSLMAPRLSELGKSDAILVAAPSGKVASAKRGFQPAQVLAKQLGRQIGLPNLAALKPKVEVADQAALSREQRLENMHQSLIASKVLRGKRVILVDDIVTTGATLTEAKRAVEQVGGLPVFFATFAETILKFEHLGPI
jgi:ComF family protein